MYTLNVEAESNEFIRYLLNETAPVGPNTFRFENQKEAGKVISRYMLYWLREHALSHFMQSSALAHMDKDDFLLYISSGDIIQLLQAINRKLMAFLSHQDFLHFEGFIRFRLKEEQEKTCTVVKRALDDFQQFGHSHSNLFSLEEMLRQQPSAHSELFIVAEPNGTLTLRSSAEVLFSDSGENEDLILSYLILFAPRTVQVHEADGQLSRDGASLLKRLFKERVVFTNGRFIADPD